MVLRPQVEHPIPTTRTGNNIDTLEPDGDETTAISRRAFRPERNLYLADCFAGRVQKPKPDANPDKMVGQILRECPVDF